MKINKLMFQRLKNISLTVGLVSTFAFGHLIACNSSEVDNTPVITVPIQQPVKAMTPTDIYYTGENVDVVYDYYFDRYLGDFEYELWLKLYLYVSDNSLFLDVNYSFIDFLTEDTNSFDYSFLLGNYTSPSDLSFNVYYNVPIPRIITNNPITYAPYELSFYFSANYLGNTFNKVWSKTYNHDTLNDTFITSGNVTVLKDFISDSFIKYVYVDRYADFQNGAEYVLSHLDEYDLYTYTQLLAYGQSEYQRGFNANSQTLSFSAFVREIFRSPISMFSDAFNFNLPLGNGETINVGGILTFFLTIGIALTIVQLILKVGGH